MKSDITNSSTLAEIIAGLLARDDLTITGPAVAGRKEAWLGLQFDEGLTFQVMVREVPDNRNVG